MKSIDASLIGGRYSSPSTVSARYTILYEYRIQVFMNYWFAENGEGAEAAGRSNVCGNL